MLNTTVRSPFLHPIVRRFSKSAMGRKVKPINLWQWTASLPHAEVALLPPGQMRCTLMWSLDGSSWLKHKEFRANMSIFRRDWRCLYGDPSYIILFKVGKKTRAILCSYWLSQPSERTNGFTVITQFFGCTIHKLLFGNKHTSSNMIFGVKISGFPKIEASMSTNRGMREGGNKIPKIWEIEGTAGGSCAS